MPFFGTTSRNRLATCSGDLQTIFNEVIKSFDCAILCGYRNEADQNKAYDEGHSKVRYPDGMHNQYPSKAADAAPYPIDWKDRERFYYFAGFVMGTAIRLYAEGKITHLVRWGGDWDQDTEVADNNFDDLVHFELYKPVVE